MKRFFVNVFIISIFVGVFGIQSLFSEIPSSLESIPIFPGCTIINEEKAPAEEGLLFGIVREYEVSASIEDVVIFYEKNLEIKERFKDLDDQNALKVGQIIKPTIQVYFYDDSQFIDGEFGEGGSSERAWIKKALQNRKKDKEGAWIENANTQWYFRDTKDTLVELQIIIEDKSINEELNKYQLKTGLTIRVIRYKYDFS